MKELTKYLFEFETASKETYTFEKNLVLGEKEHQEESLLDTSLFHNEKNMSIK
jgi:hypothetical protein